MNFTIYKIKEVCELIKGSHSSTKTPDGEYPLVVTAKDRRSSDTYQIDGEAVCIPLISSTGHGHAALHRVHYECGKFAVATLLVALIPRDKQICDAKYLYHLLMTRKDEYFVPLMMGTANVSLKMKDVAEVEIPLPPLEEQKRIVAHIEALARRIEEARGLRQGAIEEAEALLFTQIGEAYKHALSNVEMLEPLESLCHKITDGTHSTPTYVSYGIPFLSVKDITSGTIDFSNTRFITPEEHQTLTKRCNPEYGDVLLTKVGTTGFAKWIDVDKEFSIFVSLALLKINHDRLDPLYTEYMINSPQIRELSAENTRGVGNKNLVLKFIRKFPIPAPSIEVQREIINRLEIEKEKIDNLLSIQKQSRTELEALMPSILDKAFKGEL